MLGSLFPDGIEDLIFKPYNSFLRSENLGFKLFKLLSYKSLAVCKRLLSYVILGHKLLESVGHFNIIAENAVIADFELFDTCFLLLSVLNVGNISLSVGNNVTQGIKLFIKAVFNHAALAHGKRRLVNNRAVNQRRKLVKRKNFRA